MAARCKLYAPSVIPIQTFQIIYIDAEAAVWLAHLLRVPQQEGL
jgi:hypothetical protein